MKSYRVETKLHDDGTLTLQGLPFHAGQAIEVVIVPLPEMTPARQAYPLRGTTYCYVDTIEPVAKEDWEVMR